MLLLIQGNSMASVAKASRADSPHAPGVMLGIMQWTVHSLCQVGQGSRDDHKKSRLCYYTLSAIPKYVTWLLP